MICYCPTCGTPHTITANLIRWVVCPTCQHLLAYQKQNLTDHGETPPIPDVPLRFKLGDTGRLRGRWFETIGCLFYQYADDPTDAYSYWEEWLIRFKDNTIGYIVFEEGEHYFFASRSPLAKQVPPHSEINAGDIVSVEGHDVHVFEAGTNALVALIGQMPDHPLPGSTHNYFDGSLRNFVVSVEYLEDAPVLHYGIEVNPSQLEIDN